MLYIYIYTCCRNSVIPFAGSSYGSELDQGCKETPRSTTPEHRRLLMYSLLHAGRRPPSRMPPLGRWAGSWVTLQNPLLRSLEPLKTCVLTWKHASSLWWIFSPTRWRRAVSVLTLWRVGETMLHLRVCLCAPQLKW